MGAVASVGIENGGKPKGVHAQAFDVRQGIGYSFQISPVVAGAVANTVVAGGITVLKRFYHDLVNAEVFELFLRIGIKRLIFAAATEYKERYPQRIPKNVFHFL